MSWYESEMRAAPKLKKHVRIMDPNSYYDPTERQAGGGKDICDVGDLAKPRIGLTPKELSTQVNVPPEYKHEYQQRVNEIAKAFGKCTTYKKQDELQSEIHRLGVHYTLLNNRIKQLKKRDAERLMKLKEIDPKYGASAFRELDKQKFNDYIEELRRPPAGRLSEAEVKLVQEFIVLQKAEADDAREIQAGGVRASSATAVRRPPPGQIPRQPSPAQVYREPSPVRAATPVRTGPRIVKPTGPMINPTKTPKVTIRPAQPKQRKPVPKIAIHSATPRAQATVRSIKSSMSGTSSAAGSSRGPGRSDHVFKVPAVPPQRASISGNTIAQRLLEEKVRARKMLSRAPIEVGAGEFLDNKSDTYKNF